MLESYPDPLSGFPASTLPPTFETISEFDRPRIRARYLLFILTLVASLHPHPLNPTFQHCHAADARKCHCKSLHRARLLSLCLSLHVGVRVGVWVSL